MEVDCKIGDNFLVASLKTRSLEKRNNVHAEGSRNTQSRLTIVPPSSNLKVSRFANYSSIIVNRSSCIIILTCSYFQSIWRGSLGGHLTGDQCFVVAPSLVLFLGQN